MPSLFGSKKKSFRPSKKAPQRKSASLTSLNTLDQTIYSAADLQLDPQAPGLGPVRLKVGEHELVFDHEEGAWFAEGGSMAGQGGISRSTARELSQLRQQNQQLIEENNLMKFKLETLLDMLAVSNADSIAQTRELQALKTRLVAQR